MNERKGGKRVTGQHGWYGVMVFTASGRIALMGLSCFCSHAHVCYLTLPPPLLLLPSPHPLSFRLCLSPSCHLLYNCISTAAAAVTGATPTAATFASVPADDTCPSPDGDDAPAARG